MAEKIKTEELNPLQITGVIIKRIENRNPKINAYFTTTFDLPRDMANKADNKVNKVK